MFCKREKKIILNFLIKTFTFILLIWILQFSNNWKFFKSLSYKNDLKNTLNLGVKRTLAQKDITKETSEKPKFCDLGIIETNIESKGNQSKIEKKIDIEQVDEKYMEQGNEMKINEKNKKENFNQRILGKFKNNLNLISLSFAIFLLVFSFIYYEAMMISGIELPSIDAVFTTLSLLIISVILIKERIKMKFKIKFDYIYN
ncbi:Plasmodium exported protein, unknown function [Plasmodium relictum]|uniref:Fam-h protein n=1 Tax=Plasmodium relictum TaxID=85471 RepID=A0A1J1GK70_PLARL|nr:Plasmodium exported protein, unknown function [Plasmodium relictum]CRG84720.1 Plasmodium exported protein, unknown function [Plasmodium relictum]